MIVTWTTTELPVLQIYYYYMRLGKHTCFLALAAFIARFECGEKGLHRVITRRDRDFYSLAGERAEVSASLGWTFTTVLRGFKLGGVKKNRQSSTRLFTRELSPRHAGLQSPSLSPCARARAHTHTHTHKNKSRQHLPACRT
uniref:Uncharacterized protein n=1 Tax=Scleropages formosus TaxID=113540 RepID=A0A8C9WD53_SCLFO